MEALRKKLHTILSSLKRYVVVICLVIFGGMYAFLIYTSGQLAEKRPSETKINEQLQGTSRPKIDESVAERLIELEDQNIEVKTLFEEARNNPFAE